MHDRVNGILTEHLPERGLIAHVRLYKRPPSNCFAMPAAEVVHHHRLEAGLGQSLGGVTADVARASSN
jgi:hypothetical protein